MPTTAPAPKPISRKVTAVPTLLPPSDSYLPSRMNAPQQKIFNLGFVLDHFSCLQSLPETFSVSVLQLDFRFVIQFPNSNKPYKIHRLAPHRQLWLPRSFGQP